MPETRSGRHRIPVAECEITATITLSKEKGISALLCGKEKKIHTYLFDADRWSMEQAKAWVKERRASVESTAPDLAEHQALVQFLTDFLYNQAVDYSREIYGDMDDWREVTEKYLNAESEMTIGRMGGPEAAGPDGKCICPQCGYEIEHDTGKPCYGLVCPECGAKMTREPEEEEGTKEAEETLSRKGGPEAGGPGGKCRCPKCGYEMEHETAEPCDEIKCPECGATMARVPEGEEIVHEEEFVPILSLSLPAAERIAKGELDRIVHTGNYEELALAPIHIMHENRVYARVVLSLPVNIGGDIYSYSVKVLESYDPPLETWGSGEALSEAMRQAFGSPGGKHLLAGTIVGLMPKHKTFVEPFVGGGAVFFKKDKSISQTEVLNDIYADLMATYKFIRDASTNEVKKFKSLNWVLQKPLWEKLKAMKPAPPLQRAYRFIYVRLGSFAHGEDTFSPSQQDSGRKIGMPDRFEALQERLKGVKLHNEDWLSVAKKYDAKDTWVFFDPPYPGDAPGWDKTPQGPTLEQIAKGLKSLKSMWLLTINDTKEVIGAFKGANMKRVKISTRAGRGGDMKSKADTELMIANYPLKGTQKESVEIVIDDDGQEYLVEVEDIHVPDEEGTSESVLLDERVSWRLPPFSNEGGSYFLAPTVRDILPPHDTFVETHCGASNILFSKYPVATEVLNDTDAELIRAYEDIRALTLEQLIELRGCNWFPWKRRFDDLKENELDGEVGHLYRFLYLSWYSFDSNRKDYRGRPKNWNLEARLGRVENARVRLREVKLTSEDGIACIKRWDSPATAFFLDPPFPASEGDISILQEALRGIAGKFVLRISDTPEHRDLLAAYRVMSTSAVKRAGQAASWEDGEIVRARSELLVTNCDVPESLGASLLEGDIE